MYMTIGGTNVRSITVDGQAVGLVSVDGKPSHMAWKAGAAAGNGSQGAYADRLELYVPTNSDDRTDYRTFEVVVPFDYTGLTTMHIDWSLTMHTSGVASAWVGLGQPDTAYNTYVAYLDRVIDASFARRTETLDISAVTYTALVPKVSVAFAGKYGTSITARLYNIWFT